MIDALSLEFMQNALIAGLLVSAACGIIGTLVVVNRIVFISGGIAHAAYGGIGLAFFMGFAPIYGALGFALAVGLLVAFITLNNKKRADTVIGVIWALGMSAGIILVDMTPGYNVDLMSYLFGSLLAVPDSDIYLMMVMDVIILASAGYFYKDLQAMSMDEEFARSAGVPVGFLHVALIVLISLTVVMTIRVVGLVLVIALLTIPPYIAEMFSRSLKSMMILSFLLGVFFTVAGLALAYTLNLTGGASIIAVGGAVFFIALGVKRIV
ncbi:metal ABC transporter permease [Limisalsivibrio acetivorans]|uniref:metal ABC transporter permease n=1 Tax=Limisalsivibrio acetivorans TaxID=1304888 RepID=UPI0003B779B8|nr:metal ABC transporter permease [Limisalsivibrio acetivorans]